MQTTHYSSRSSSLKVLIIEDHPQLREDILDAASNVILKSNIVAAKNDVEAREILKNQIFDVILTDIILDDSGGSRIGGLEILREMRSRGGSVKVIVYTAFGDNMVTTHDGRTITAVDYAGELGVTARKQDDVGSQTATFSGSQ